MNSEFTALFQGPTSRSNPTQDFRCVLAKASPGLRKVLLKRGITFMSVLSPQKIKTSYTGLEDAGDEEKKEARVELREMERIQPGRTVASASVHMIPMQLLMNGLDSVTKLYEYLLDWVEHSVEKRALHLPMLVSPSPFLHASLKMAEPRCAFTMKLAGILLPSSVATMKEIVEFSCMGSESVKIMMTSEERTIGLNLELGSTVRQGEAEADVENPVKAHIDAKTCGKVVNLLQFDEGKWLQ
ncbi:hypothetical protein BC830DRAFT_397589 [Chytriomyces sp. MP71]|nr:hypothetical protein BC830DRAFT_397589 [Chytriomyces sp. MP71]